MNLIEKWKNRETKKSLREENIRLKAQVEMLHRVKPPICTVERNVQALRVRFEVNRWDRDMPAECIKNECIRQMVNHLKPFIEYDFHDIRETGGRVYTGTLYVATGDRKHEH